MAFALTKIVAYGVEAEEVVNKRYKQVLQLTCTAANTDVDLDLGDYAGTFWGTVDGSEPGDTGLQAIKDIQTKAKELVGVDCEAILAKIKIVTPSGVTHYAITMNSTNDKLPDVLWYTGGAPTAFTIELSWILEDGEVPVEVAAAA